MTTQPYYSVRNSKIHGRGVFAKRPIRKGIQVIEYTGPIISVKEADKKAADDETGHSHTMLFTVDDKRVIDGTRGGDARYINHSCSPNCEAIQDGDKIFIEAIRPIKQGEELVYDYHLVVAGKITDEVKKQYACFCGSPNCRGTQIDAKILAKQAKKDAKKDAKKKKKDEKKRLKQVKKMQKASGKVKDKAKAKKDDSKKDKKDKDKKKKDTKKPAAKPKKKTSVEEKPKAKKAKGNKKVAAKKNNKKATAKSKGKKYGVAFRKS